MHKRASESGQYPVKAEVTAVELCLEVQGESVEPLDFIGVQKITVA
jgi:hypothetical protein